MTSVCKMYLYVTKSILMLYTHMNCVSLQLYLYLCNISKRT